MTNHFVAYYRVSTQKQGVSGLGLDAQKAAVSAYLASLGGSLIAEYTEIESGRKRVRPQLVEALAACKRQKARLVIAKLDRLGRSVAFISTLMESQVDFVACDNPHAAPLVLHVLAAFAEHEAREISRRTKDALKAAKTRGVALGMNGRTLADQNRRDADAFALSVSWAVEDCRYAGVTSVRGTCAALNERGIPSAQGKRWNVQSTHALLKRLEGLNG